MLQAKSGIYNSGRHSKRQENRYSEIGSQAMKEQSMRSLPNLNARNMFPQEHKQQNNTLVTGICKR